MAKQRPDFSMKREGRPLEAWLPELVSEDEPTRRAAGEALQAMMYGLPSVRTNLVEIEWGSSTAVSDQAERFKDAIRATVKSSGFDARGFVRKLILYRMALKDDWRRRVDKAHEEDNAADVYQDRLLQRLQAADGDVERAEATRRYLRWVCASMARTWKRGQETYSGAESMASSGLVSFAIFDTLDDSLLVDRPGLHAMLADEDIRHEAARALARIGPPAVDFAATFFEELDTKQSGRFFEGAKALGSIGREDPDVVDGLLRRLRSGPVGVRSGAASALFHAGPPLAGRLEVALDLLLGATYTPELIFSAIPALASVGRDGEPAFRRVLEVAQPRPPRWQSSRDFPDDNYDEVMSERGTAIDSLRHFQRFADRAVPVLVDALDTFEEYDPDWSYGGDHERVCAALTTFGPLAAPAVPWLVRYLEEWAKRPQEDREWPKDVFQLLTAIGAPAIEALPLLEEIRVTQMGDVEPFPPELNLDEPLDRVIITLRRAIGKA